WRSRTRTATDSARLSLPTRRRPAFRQAAGALRIGPPTPFATPDAPAPSCPPSASPARSLFGSRRL
ncbi:MAG: hypothetical protein AVDCRST_MAG27-1022, partial [uncultured Craurococcus sp.]